MMIILKKIVIIQGCEVVNETVLVEWQKWTLTKNGHGRKGKEIRSKSEEMWLQETKYYHCMKILLEYNLNRSVHTSEK